MVNPDWWPGEDHEAFTVWAMENGVEAFGVTPARFPGRGLGMMATREIKVGFSALQRQNVHIRRRQWKGKS